MFDHADYERAAAALSAPVAHIMAVAAVESSGENFWTLGNQRVPAIRPEAHIFDARTAGRFRASHPHLSAASWTPSLAAKTKAGAWQLLDEMRELDAIAADEATSWGPFQIMGFHWKALGYPSVKAFVDDVDGPSDDGQMDSFVRFINASPALAKALRHGDWETFERLYNGGGFGGAYAAKIRDWLSSGERGTTPRVLRMGMVGMDVAELQRQLRVTADGHFGVETDRAVRKAQEASGLVVDGLVGAMTKRALGMGI